MKSLNTAPSQLRSIALGARSESRLFLVALARELRRRYGSQIHLYCSSPQEVIYYRDLNHDGTFDSINDGQVLYKRAFDQDLDEKEVMARARELEARCGLTINQMAVPNRHFGRGYALGGLHHPRSRHSELTDYKQMVHAYCSSLNYWEQEFIEKGITLCIGGSREAANIARTCGIPYRVMAGSRYGSYHYWAWNEFYETPTIEQAWKSNPGISDPEIKMDEPYHSHQANRARFLRNFTLRTLVSNCALTTARHIYWRLRGYEKAKGYYYSEEMRYHYRCWDDYRRLKRIGTRQLAELEGQRFVYFPLHVEPETALHGLSPEYFYQHALIAAVSRDLPAGCYLAVKEAYGAIGRRPKDFYKAVADLKNVVLLDVWERGFECAQKADAVVTIAGTAGLEALVAGKPVIAFGHHNIYNFLPSVRVIHDEAYLSEYLRAALDGDYDAFSIRNEAQRFLRAVVECSFDMRGYDYLTLDRFEHAAVEEACDKLLESLTEAHAEQSLTMNAN